MSQINVAIIGCGNIANSHIQALQEVGIVCNNCASSFNSKTVQKFADKYNIKNVWHDPKKLAISYSDWDGIIITTPVEPTLELLEIALESGKPILVEKPVTTNLKKLLKFSDNAPSNVLVGFNRRYYTTIQKAKDFVEKSTEIRATMTIPEKILTENIDPYFPFRMNSVHGLDILRFIFGEIEIEYSALANFKNPYFGKQIILRSKIGHLINLTLNWNSPSNFSLTLENSNRRLELIPFEKFQLFDDLKKVEASKDYPIRQYLPNQTEYGSIFDGNSLKFKPGFIDQAYEFKKIFNGQKPTIGADLNDAFHAQMIADKILN